MPLLVMDTQSWARSIRERWFEMACAAQESAQALFHEYQEASDVDQSTILYHEYLDEMENAVSLHETVSEIDHWFIDGTRVSGALFPLSLRQEIQPRQVGMDNLVEYFAAVSDRITLLGHPEPVLTHPQFLFIADGYHPTIYALPELRTIIQHTGKDIRSVNLDVRALRQKVRNAWVTSQNKMDSAPVPKYNYLCAMC